MLKNSGWYIKDRDLIIDKKGPDSLLKYISYEEIESDNSKYGPLEIVNVKTYINKTGKVSYIGSLKDLKGNQYSMVLPEIMKNLKDNVIKNYKLKKIKFHNKQLEKIVYYEVVWYRTIQ